MSVKLITVTASWGKNIFPLYFDAETYTVESAIESVERQGWTVLYTYQEKDPATLAGK